MPVAIHDFKDGRRGDELCSTMSDARGAFSCAIGPISGAFVVEAADEARSKLRTIVQGVELGEARTGIMVTPVTELVTAYVEHLALSGIGFDEALVKAQQLVEGHFGHIDHEQVAPSALDANVRSLSAETMVAIMLVGFEALAKAEIAEGGDEAQGFAGASTLVVTLSEDIAADGVFDGRGRSGQLRFGGTALNGDTLRAEYARAILSWLSSSENPTHLLPADLAPSLGAIAKDGSEIFPSGAAEPLNDRGPQVSRFVVRSGTRELDKSDPVRGDIFAELSASSPDAIGDIALAVEDPTADVVELVAEHSGYALWRIRAHLLPDGSHAFHVVLKDVDGNETRIDSAFLSDNTPPTLTATAAGVVDAPMIQVRGTVVDAIGPVTRIEMSGGGARATISNPGREYAGALDVPCEATWPITVRAFDAAGNVATATVTVRCDSTPPAIGWIASVFQQESTLLAVYSADGTSVYYLWSSLPAEFVRLDLGGTATITKYFNRFDEGSDNLPTYRFWASDQEGGVRVDYRYLSNGQGQRGWMALPPVSTGAPRNEYALKVSYQALGPSVSTSATSDVQLIEIRATDDAGNVATMEARFKIHLLSPPVWLGNCRIDPALAQYTLRDRTLDALYRQATIGVALADLSFVLGLPPASLAPKAGALVNITPGGATSRVTEVSEDRHDGLPITTMNDPYFWCYPNGPEGLTRIGPDGQHLGSCSDPETSEDHVASDAPSGGALNDAQSHVVSISLSDDSGRSVAPTSAGEFAIEPDRRNTLTISLVEPALRFDGVLYSWATSFSVPSGYRLRTEPPRYRVGKYDRAGWNFEYPPLGQLFAYPFVTRAYMSALEIDVTPPALSARNPALLPVPIGIQASAECQRTLAYLTHL